MAVRLARQPKLGLRELLQRPWVSVEHFPRALKVSMRNAGVPSSPCKNCCIDGVLTHHDRAATRKQSTRPAYSACFHECLDKPVLDMRHRVLRSLRLERLQDFLGSFELAALGVGADHLCGEDPGTRIGLPRARDPAVGLHLITESAQMSRIAQRGKGAIFRMRWQRGLEVGALLVELESGHRRSVGRHRLENLG